MACTGSIFGPCPAPSPTTVNIKKIFIQLYSGAKAGGSCPPHCTCCADVLGLQNCGGSAEAELVCGGFANAVAWLNGQSSAFESQAWNTQVTAVFNTSDSTVPDCTSTSSISALDCNGSYWGVGNLGSGGCCDGCLNNCFGDPQPYDCSTGGGSNCPVLTAQMMAVQMGVSLWEQYAPVYQTTSTVGLGPCPGAGCPPLDTPGICLAFGNGTCESCSPSGADPLMTYYFPMPDFNTLCATAASDIGVLSASSYGCGMTLLMGDAPAVCAFDGYSCGGFTPSGSYIACGDDPP